ncbi:class I SAM-dependent methyltransferase [Actinoplanes sp. NPDC051494]|uniref:class I SAM-dependent methyltransferase n=1 Tax=Actinoplanes sp. NPDC051494 TaxID=3363907 RepID=UPI0037ACE2BC
MGAALVADLILPPIRPLLSRCPGLTVHPDPYHGPFEAYHFLATGAQTWDVDATLAVAAGRPGPVLDLGCGRGRLATALVAAGHEVTAVDTAAASLRHLRPAPGLTVVEGDALRPGTLPDHAYATVVVGDLSVNMFAGREELGVLFGAVDRLLAPGAGC